MPRPAKVKIDEAVTAICAFRGCISAEGELPVYTDKFYSDVSEKLNKKWTGHDVYINLRENRRELRTKVFKQLGLTLNKLSRITTNLNVEETLDESCVDENYKLEASNSKEAIFSTSFANDEEAFDFCIRHELWEQIKPVPCIYNGREYLLLKPRVWSDVIADEFWRQYRMPCAFSFKKNSVSRNPEMPFLTILGTCKSLECGNKFLGVADKEPVCGEDVWLKVKMKDTRGQSHEELKRQLRNNKRQVIGQQVVKEGAANLRRKIAIKEQNLGDMEAPILYKNDVLRKLAQECNDKEIGVDPKDSNNPALILQKLKQRTPYIGSINKVSLVPFILVYILPEQVFLFKEYCRIFKMDSSICIDSTASLVLPLEEDNNIKSPVIFLYEIVINLFNVTVSVGQMLSSMQDTNTILYFLNSWLSKVGIIPKQAVSDYSRALLAANSLSFNCMSLKAYIRNCFLALQDEPNVYRPAPTFIRVDVAHLIAIFCRLKCFTPDKKPVKDFLIRCVALLVSCEDFERFEEILLLILTVSIQAFDGKIYGGTLLSPAEKARLQLFNYIANEKHCAISSIPDETSEEFKATIKKLSFSGIDTENPNFLNEEPESDMSVSTWLTNLKTKAEEGKDTEHERANAYFLPQFYHHLCRIAPEFVLWTAVMNKFFKSNQIRATSCFVEGDFGELKNGILKGVHKALRSDKLFRIHFQALKGQVLIASAAITSFLMEKTKIAAPPIENETEDLDGEIFPRTSGNILETPIASSSFIVENNIICTKSDFLPSENITAESEDISFSNENWKFSPNPELYEKENWRNKGEKEDVLLTSNVIFSDIESKHNYAKKTSLTDVIPSQLTKRTLEPSKRKPSKFFKACPDIKIQQNAALHGHCKFSRKSKKWLLQNGCLFSTPIEIQNQMYFIKYTCPFDVIVQTLVAAAMDYPQYYEHVEKSFNQTCQFLLVLIDSGVAKHVYVQRGLILKDFVNPKKPAVTSHLMLNNKSPKVLRSMEVDSNVTEMWEFLMQNEPSVYRLTTCDCGYSEITEVPFLYLNNTIIQIEGFQKIEKAILHNLDRGNKCNCGRTMVEEISVNAHVFIETDIRKAENLNSSLTCKVTDFPSYISLYGEKLRLIGVVAHRGNHYTTACKRSNDRWELYDDTIKHVPFFNAKTEITPSAVIYIKVKE